MQDSSITFTLKEVSAYYAARVPNLKQWRADEWRGPCPIHGGERDSFAVDSNTGLWHCHSTCDRGGDILALEAALNGGDFPTVKAEVYRIIGRAASPNGSRPATARIASTYDYVDEAGQLLFQVVRMEPKGFSQRRPDGTGGWVWNIKGVRSVLYRLQELLKRSSEAVFICEGEKDADSLAALGLLATCNPMGAGKWRPAYSEAIRSRSVVLLPDNDPRTDESGKPHFKGQKHAASVAADLLRVGCEARIVEVPAAKDLSDWLAAGGTLEGLQALVREQQELTVEALAIWRARWELDSHTQTAPDHKPRKAIAVPETSAFRLTDGGVVYIDSDPDREPLTICGRLEIAALTRDSKGDGWGRLLRWVDSEGRTHEWAMPMSLLAGDGSEYRGRLLDGGLFLAPGRKARDLLTSYLQTTRSDAWALCVARVGWYGESFILPGATIGPAGAEIVLFQTPFEVEHHLSVSGTAEDWRENVGRFCSGNSRLILAVSCAFAGPVLSLVGGESGGVHFIGATSTGKSTALLVGGSVLGGGGRNGFVQSWRTTANGLEATAELHNDLTLFLDELAQMDAHEATETAYLLGNGCGKARMSRNIGVRKKLSWSLLFVSAGEVTLADHAQTVGKRIRGGAEVRLLNIEADAGTGSGLFEKLHGAGSPDAFSRQLKGAAQRFFGAPLRAYLDHLVRNRASVEPVLRKLQADFVSTRIPADASGEVFRAAQRLGLIAAAGELATEVGITGWEPGEAIGAAARCFKSWIARRGTTGAADTEEAINQVRRFLEAHGASRFQVVRQGATEGAVDEREVVANRVGFRRTTAEGEVEFLIMREAFKSDVCSGLDYRMVARALAERGLLDHDPHALTKRVRVPVFGLTRVFSVRSSIVEG